MIKQQSVFIVDDDSDVLDAMSVLLRSNGLTPRAFPSAYEFLSNYHDEHGCLLLDVRMPDMSGLELQRHMKNRGIELPIIFITGHGDVPMAVDAMKNGALEFVQKPFRDQELLDCIYNALELNQRTSEEREYIRKIQTRIHSLTRREHEVMEHMVAGEITKVIAADLGVSPRTAELHRARVMEKMGVRTLAQLVQMVVHARGNQEQEGNTQL